MQKSKILVFIVTYNSSFRLRLILNKLKTLGKKIKFDVLISDDASTDNTRDFFPKNKNKYFLRVNKKNLGYGGNVKKCINFAVTNNYSYCLMIHGDNQYDCRYLEKFYKQILKDKADAVTGSRMKNLHDAIIGKMPLYKIIGNMILTGVFNFVFNTKFTDAHNGIWLYDVRALKSINLNKIDDGYNFDNQLRIKMLKNNKKIVEIPIKTYYRNEKSSFHIIYAIKFVIDIITLR